MPEFVAFHKIPRLNRDMIVTEKIDGTNAAVIVAPFSDGPFENEPVACIDTGDTSFAIWAQSRKRLIYPGKSRDNYGFARWVADHADELAQLGPGYHFGEWWGEGIQRGYDCTEKRFSLFNVGRWAKPDEDSDPRPACCGVVPVIKRYAFSQDMVQHCIDWLRENGSVAAPGYMNPEGVVVYHRAANQMFKVTLEGDEKPKGQNA